MQLLDVSLLVVLAAMASPAMSQGARDSCQFAIGHLDGYLKARCADGSGGYMATEEDMNLCLGNDFGTLVAQDE
jgi:hypothetical protein